MNGFSAIKLRGIEKGGTDPLSFWQENKVLIYEIL